MNVDGRGAAREAMRHGLGVCLTVAALLVWTATVRGVGQEEALTDLESLQLSAIISGMATVDS